MEKDKLILTLGHNSSALLVGEDGRVKIGFEEERLTRSKSSSAFPKLSIQKCEEKTSGIDSIYIGHWFDDFNFLRSGNQRIKKYFDGECIDGLVKKYGSRIVSLKPEFTHHDSHAHSVLQFNKEHGGKDEGHILVVDGFGNRQEVLSIYSYKGNNVNLVQRSFGFENSLGLFYQYATSFCGMKENQDEYKFLGYESAIQKVLTHDSIKKLEQRVKVESRKFLNNINSGRNSFGETSYIDIPALEETKRKFHGVFSEVINGLDYEKNRENTRVVVGYFVQKVVEETLVDFVKQHGVKDLLVNGGVFYNVKLNNTLEKNLESLCINPLAGDQGAGIGIAVNDGVPFKFGDLCYGERKFVDDYDRRRSEKENLDNIIYTYTPETTLKVVSDLLKSGEIVNVVRGNMEFGPRALCNTTTFSIPSKKNVELINTYNNRNTVMPMAPVILRENAETFFESEDLKKTIGSDSFMILTYDYKNFDEKYEGVMHKYPMSDKYSGRPQFVEPTSFAGKLLRSMSDTHKALINTSYNVHGVPIVFSQQDAIDDFRYQMARVNELGLPKKPYLVLEVSKNE